MASKAPGQGRPVLRSALVIDPDTGFLESIRKDRLFGKLDPVLLERGDEAQKLIQDPGTRFAGVFVSSTVAWPCAIPLIREVHRHHPATPVFLLYRDFTPFSDKELQRLAVQEEIRKPVTFADMIRRVLPGGELPQVPASAVPLQAAPAATGGDDPGEDFIPVVLEEFLCESPSFFDVYVRVPTGKYLKILDAKETLGRDRVVKYLESGASYLYVRRSSLMRCLSYCEFLSQNLLQAADIAPEMKFLHTAGLGTDFLNQFKSSAAPESFNLDYGFAFLGGIFNLVRQQKTEVGKEQLVKDYLKNASAIEHAVGVSFLCAMLSLPLKIDTPKLCRQLGLASLFHDIGLAKMKPEWADEDESKISAGDKKEFESHPVTGADILSHLKGIESIAIQAVRQHHERRDNSGYPNRVAPGEIHIFAEMIGICDEFSRLLLRKRKEPQLNLQDDLEKRVFKGFSSKVVEAFRSVFFRGGVLQPIQPG